MKVRRYFKGNSLLILRFQVGVYISQKSYFFHTLSENNFFFFPASINALIGFNSQNWGGKNSFLSKKYQNE